MIILATRWVRCCLKMRSIFEMEIKIWINNESETELTHFAVTSFRRADIFSRAKIFPPTVAWMATWNSCFGIDSFNRVQMRFPYSRALDAWTMVLSSSTTSPFSIMFIYWWGERKNDGEPTRAERRNYMRVWSAGARMYWYVCNSRDCLLFFRLVKRPSGTLILFPWHT